MELVVETASKRASLKDDHEEAFYSIYAIGDKTVACRSMRMHNEVGTKVWGAGLFLSSLCINRPDLFASRRVVELGCGIGLTGLCLSIAKSPPRSIVLSDYTADTMNNLSHNIELNRPIVSSDCSLMTLRLDWTLYKDASSQYHQNVAQKLGAVDVILAADCTYSPDICVDLTESIKLMLQTSNRETMMSPKYNQMQATRDGSSDEVTPITPSCMKTFPYALVASTLRSEETFLCFQAALRESDMIVDDITEWAATAGQSSLFYQSDVSVEVIKVFCLRLR
jgi:predicted nicotinamide N-methyase